METLNEKEQLVFEFIKDYITANNYPPSIRDILKGTKFNSTSTVSSYLDKLEQKGYIIRKNSKTRAIEIADKNFYKKDFNLVPLVGQVAAGVPILAEENVEDMFPLPANIKFDDDIFMLRIKGDSMINKGILSGDLVIVRKQQVVNNGEIAIALLDEEATCKTFYKEKGYIRLQPENDEYEPIIVDDVSIVGKVIGLYRNI